MTFSSVPFLFYFLPIFLGLYFLSPFKNAALLAGSLIFYAWGEPWFVLLLIGSLVFNHVIGAIIVKHRNRAALICGIAANLAFLGWFKYAGFFASLMQDALGVIGIDISLTIEAHLPLGISFYTFQAISFLVDLYRKDAEQPRSVIDTALYISMFPQLIAGPIVRYKTIASQIQRRTHSLEKFAGGARVFILGLAQKALLANTFAVVADNAFTNAAAHGISPAAAWIGLAAYSLQIYFDFAGYSNMAIGMGRMMGFELPRNFNFPYIAQSVTEFWRRWHITLSQWFRDYLYIPLGGNRVAPVRTYLNLWIVFLLCGLWHGAAITFVIWGAYHGAFLVMERAFLSEKLKRAPAFLRHFYLPLVVAIGWVPFRAESIGAALDYYRIMLGFGGKDQALTVSDMAPDGIWFVFIVGVAAAFWPLFAKLRPPNLNAKFSTMMSSARGAAVQAVSIQIVLALLLLASAASLAGGAYNPFIYFRF